MPTAYTKSSTEHIPERGFGQLPPRSPMELRTIEEHLLGCEAWPLRRAQEAALFRRYGWGRRSSRTCVGVPPDKGARRMPGMRPHRGSDFCPEPGRFVKNTNISIATFSGNSGQPPHLGVFPEESESAVFSRNNRTTNRETREVLNPAPTGEN